MNEYHAACTTLFRAMLGEEPRPTVEEIKQARVFLQDQPEFHTALDELVGVVVLAKDGLPAAWRDQLQAYVTAQITGQMPIAEFAQLRQQLDASVALSEEYALLYETMACEAQGLVLAVVDAPPLNLDFLSAKAKTESVQTRNSRWWHKFTRVNLPWPLSAPWPGHTQWGWFASSVALFLLLLGLVLGLWDFAHPPSPPLAVTPTTLESQPQPSAFFHLQMQLETSSPATTPVLSYEIAQEPKQCTQIRQTSFARTICKI